MDQRRRHQVRGVQDGVRDARIALGQLENIVAGRVEADKGDVLVGSVALVRLEEGDLNKVLDLALFGRCKEGGEDLLPSPHVWNGTEDGLDATERLLEVVGVSPVEVDDSGALGSELFRGLLSKTLVANIAIAFPDTDAHVLDTGLQQTEGDAVSNHTGSGGDENSAQVGVEGELSKTRDDISEGLSCLDLR